MEFGESLKLFDVESIYHTAEASSSSSRARCKKYFIFRQSRLSGIAPRETCPCMEKTAIQEWQCRVRIS